MRSAAIIAAAGLSGLATAAPFKFPLADGFPSPSNTSLANIEKIAGGTTPNGALPPKIDDSTTTSFQLIAFNEIFEVAFFSQLVQNITNGVPGYEIPDGFALEALTAIVAQEELHALTANAILSHFNKTTITPCEYQFPVSSFDEAIVLAQTFTDVVIGTLNDVQTLAATTLGTDGAGYVNALAGVIGQEAQQTGYYRILQSKKPSAEPFLTGAARAFAWNALQSFVVPGSCPKTSTVNLPLFAPLTLLTNPAKDGNLTFQAAPHSTAQLDPSCQRLAYINGANVPLVVPFTANGTMVTAAFPQAKNDLDGLTIAAIVNGTGPFSGPDDVAKATIFGPGLIESN